MRKLLFAFTALTLAAPAAALAQTPTAPAQAAPSAAALDVPDIVFRERRLANGMRVLTALDRSTPNVAGQGV